MKTNKKSSILENTIKIGGFVIAIVGAITAFITWENNQKKPDPLTTQRIELYTKISTLIGEMLNEKNSDSMEVLSGRFYDLYNGEMILVEDSSVSLAMRRFKFEVDDKHNGVKNLLQPNKYQISGMAVVKAYKNHLVDLNKN